MNLYLITRTSRTDYDEYDSAVVVAASEEEAKRIHPEGTKWPVEANKYVQDLDHNTRVNWEYDWVHPSRVQVQLIGTAAEGISGVVCASFNAG